MPLFEYDCPKCGLRFEVLVRDGSHPPCPQCGAAEPVKVLSMFAVASENTRSTNLQSARKQSRKIVKEKQVAEAEAIRHAHDDHM
jgi:putative FmdB family regulatory protein